MPLQRPAAVAIEFDHAQEDLETSGFPEVFSARAVPRAISKNVQQSIPAMFTQGVSMRSSSSSV